MMNERQLCECENGISGIVSRVDGNTHSTSRLRELGFVPGQWVHILQSGSLYQIAVGESRLCISRDQLEGISLCPMAEEPQAVYA